MKTLESRVDRLYAYPWGYYVKHHYGLTQDQLRVRDPEVYCLLGSNGDLARVPLNFGSNARAYCEHHYPDVSSPELMRKNKKLYRKLEDLQEVSWLASSKRRQKKTALELYDQHYPGVFQDELKFLDPYLVQRLSFEGDWRAIPKYDRIEADPWRFYLAECNGASRSELRNSHTKAYQVLKARGLLDRIPLRKTGLPKGYKFATTVSEPKPTYQDAREKLFESYLHAHRGLTAQELYRVNPELYHQMKDAKIAHRLPTAREKNWLLLRAHYRKETAPFTDPLRELKVVGKILRRDRHQALARYFKKHEGLARLELKRTDGATYRQLCLDGLLSYVPAKDQLEHLTYVQQNVFAYEKNSKARAS